MRKFLAWYVKGCPGAAALRPRLMLVSSLDDIEAVLDKYLSEIGSAAHDSTIGGDF